MNNFVKGILFGVGIGLLVAPMKGDEMRKMVSERFGELRGYLPENDQLNDYKDQLSNCVSQTASNLKDYAQQAASTVKSSANSLSNTAQNAGDEVKSTGQDLRDASRNTLNKSSNNL